MKYLSEPQPVTSKPVLFKAGLMAKLLCRNPSTGKSNKATAWCIYKGFINVLKHHCLLVSVVVFTLTGTSLPLISNNLHLSNVCGCEFWILELYWCGDQEFSKFWCLNANCRFSIWQMHKLHTCSVCNVSVHNVYVGIFNFCAGSLVSRDFDSICSISLGLHALTHVAEHPNRKKPPNQLIVRFLSFSSVNVLLWYWVLYEKINQLLFNKCLIVCMKRATFMDSTADSSLPSALQYLTLSGTWTSCLPAAVLAKVALNVAADLQSSMVAVCPPDWKDPLSQIGMGIV